MNESTVRISGALLKIRVMKAFIFVRDNRQRIFKERLNHYLYVVNYNNHRRSKKWWSFLVPKKFKVPVDESQVSSKIKKRLECNWGDIERLKKIEMLCITGHDIIVCSSDMEALLTAENANSWKSSAIVRTQQDIKNIWS